MLSLPWGSDLSEGRNWRTLRTLAWRVCIECPNITIFYFYHSIQLSLHRLCFYDANLRQSHIGRKRRRSIPPDHRPSALRIFGSIRTVEIQKEPLLRFLQHFSDRQLAYAQLPQRSWF